MGYLVHDIMFSHVGEYGALFRHVSVSSINLFSTHNMIDSSLIVANLQISL